MRSGRVEKIYTSLPPFSKDKGLKEIVYNTSIGNLMLGVDSVTVKYLIRHEGLLPNATAILLQNAAEGYYKMRQVFYYKMRQLLQIAAILLQNATIITKCDFYYKLRQCTLPLSQK